MPTQGLGAGGVQGAGSGWEEAVALRPGWATEPQNRFSAAPQERALRHPDTPTSASGTIRESLGIALCALWLVVM